MTDRLYYTDAYLARFRAAVVERADDGRRIYLDRTAFYPTSGGQPHDLGWLGGVPVTDVIDEGERIAHLLEQPLVATIADGEVDWPRRFDHMQQHTGQHLLSAVFAEHWGWRTASVHFGPASCTIDLEATAIDPAVLAEAEARANAVVWENRPVLVSFESAGDAEGLRKASTREGTLRIVSIADLDRSACGGTHVRATGEVGVILVRRAEKVKQGIRVEFLCGVRAMARARRDAEALGAVAAGFSAMPDDAPALVARQRDALREATASRAALLEELARHRAAARHAAAAPDADGIRRVVLRLASAAPDELRAEAQAVASLPGAVLLALVEAPPTVLLATSADSGVDAGAELKAALAAVGGRGGGSPRLAQGTVPDRSALDAVAARLAPTNRPSDHLTI